MTGAAELPRKLSVVDSAAIVVGTVIGSAVFIVPNSVASNLQSVPAFLGVWVFTGLLSFFGALAYAELGAMMPSTGGQYVYLREAYGPLPAFLCGWAFFLVIQSGSIATLAAGFSIYLSYFVPLHPVAARLVSVVLILALTFVNYRGVRQGAAVQKTFTVLKLAGISILVASAFFATREAAPAAAAPAPFAFRQFGIAMIACLWAYEGWYCISFVAGEVVKPQRNIPLALGLGVATIMAIYLSANLAYLKMLPLAEIAETPRVAATVAERTLGALGGTFVSLTILLSVIGSTNGTILTAARVYFAQAREREPPRRFSLEYFGGPASFVLAPDGRGGTDLTLVNDGVSPVEWIETLAGWLNVLFPLKGYLAFGVDLRNHDRERLWDHGYRDA